VVVKRDFTLGQSQVNWLWRCGYRPVTLGSAAEFAEEIGFFHAVFEGLAAVDEDYRDFVGELAAELFVAVDIDVLPGESAAAMQFGQALFDDFAEVAALAGVDHDLAKFGHSAEFNKGGRVYSRGSIWVVET
jgi:hypothetical protein